MELGQALEKGENMSKEMIHPSVELEEVVKIVDNSREDTQLRDPEKEDEEKKEQCIERLALKEVVTEEDVVDFINEYRDIQYKGAMEVDEDGEHYFWKQITHYLVINEIANKNVIPQIMPYNSNWVPSKAEVVEFDANNEKMKTRLAKEDKMKGVEIDKPVDRPSVVVGHVPDTVGTTGT